jgi:ribosomal protein L29
MATKSTRAPTNAEIVRLLEALRSALAELRRSLAARQS